MFNFWSKKSEKETNENDHQLESYSPDDGNATLILLTLYAEELSRHSFDYDLKKYSEKLQISGFNNRRFNLCLKESMDKFLDILIECPDKARSIVNHVNPLELGRAINHAVAFGQNHGKKIAMYDIKTIANNISKIADSYSTEIQDCEMSAKVLLECIQDKRSNIRDRIDYNNGLLERHSNLVEKLQNESTACNIALENYNRFPHLTYARETTVNPIIEYSTSLLNNVKEFKEKGVVKKVWDILNILFKYIVEPALATELAIATAALLFLPADSALSIIQRMDWNYKTKNAILASDIKERYDKAVKKVKENNKIIEDCREKLQQYQCENKIISDDINRLENFVQEAESLCLMWKSTALKFNKVKESFEMFKLNKKVKPTALSEESFKSFKREGEQIVAACLKIAADADLYREVFEHFKLDDKLGESVKRLLQSGLRNSQEYIKPIDERIKEAKDELKDFAAKFAAKRSREDIKKMEALRTLWDQAYFAKYVPSEAIIAEIL